MIKMKNKELIVPIILLLLFLLVTAMMISGKMSVIDEQVYQFLASYVSPELTRINIAVSWIGDAYFMVPVVLFLMICPATRKVFAIPVPTTCLISLFANRILKLIFERPRPEINHLVEVGHYSFPSGHAMNNMAFYTILVLLICRYAKKTSTKLSCFFGAYALVLAIGISRIYLGVHYFSDIIAGYLLGLAIAITVDFVIERIKGDKAL